MNPRFERIIAFETSCDDTSVAIVDHQGLVLSLCSMSQDLAHRPFGGVVPEIACRNHTLTILPLAEEALRKAQLSWQDLQGIVVTSRPGLIGSLMVGVVTAKTLALAKGLPLIGVNHLEGHLHAPFLRDEKYAPPPQFAYPFIALTISGGHTALYEVRAFGEYELLGKTIDDAAGEAFDKFAKMLGLDYPGGVQVDRHARQGRVDAFTFPRPLSREENFDFSFSGLKTAALRQIESLSDAKSKHLADLAASYQQAIVDSLLVKLDRAVRLKKFERVVITGGVSANSRLRECASAWAQKARVQLVIPPLIYCTDNAAMIGYVGVQRLNRGERDDFSLSPRPRSAPGDFIETSDDLA